MNKITQELWFSKEEYQYRISKIRNEINKLNIDALIVFFPENVTWSTGFFTRGYSSFQFAIIPATGEPHIVCRDVEEFYIKKSSQCSRTLSFSSTTRHLRNRRPHFPYPSPRRRHLATPRRRHLGRWRGRSRAMCRRTSHSR